MWGGVAGLVISIFAIIILFLTRQSIVSILNKDKILFDESFHLKKEAVFKALTLVDELETTNGVAKGYAEFNEKAKSSYNDLLCVLSDVRIADEFYNIAINPQTELNLARNAQFKLMCRKDIGLKIGKAQTLKRVIQQQKSQTTTPVQPTPVVQQPQAPIQPQATSQYVQSQPTQPVQQSAARPTRPIVPGQPTRIMAQPQVRRVSKPREDQ